MVDNLSSKELVRRTLRGEHTGRPVAGPMAIHYCAELIGVSLRDFTLNPRIMADCTLRYYEKFRPDAIWVDADTWVTAEAMGAAVGFPAGNQPMGGTGEPCVRTAGDIDKIPPPDPQTQGRIPLMLEALRYMKEAVGDEVALVGCFDQYPFSLACALMGIERVMTGLVDDRPMIEALMHRCAGYTVAYALALSDGGVDVLSGGDSPSGLIGPRYYREIALPFEQRVIREIKEQSSAPVSLHICGDATPILADMASSGADVLELDQCVDMRVACRTLPPSIAIWGNLDPVALLAQAAPDEVYRTTADLLRTMKAFGRNRFVASSGCTLAPGTPAENLQAMLNAVRDGYVEFG